MIDSFKAIVRLGLKPPPHSESKKILTQPVIESFINNGEISHTTYTLD
ncbi:hypothetical protein OSCI_3020027 [Kamptonema sp. PCC 6506]|nr:hypothetical protein OSCI_3020027 [Kamptonema sp. PCC 6506]